MRRTCSLRGALPLWGAPERAPRSGAGLPLGKQDFPTTWIFPYPAPSWRPCRPCAARRSGDCVDRVQSRLRLKELPSTLAGIAVMRLIQRRFLRTRKDSFTVRLPFNTHRNLNVAPTPIPYSRTSKIDVITGLLRLPSSGRRRSMAASAISTSSCTSSGVNAPSVTMSHGHSVA